MDNKRTPRNKIQTSLRRLFLRSHEHSYVLKRDQYTCRKCGIRRSRAKDNVVKVEVHHVKGVKNWDEMVEVIRKELLCDPEDMIVLCKECHKKEK